MESIELLVLHGMVIGIIATIITFIGSSTISVALLYYLVDLTLTQILLYGIVIGGAFVGAIYVAISWIALVAIIIILLSILIKQYNHGYIRLVGI